MKQELKLIFYCLSWYHIQSENLQNFRLNRNLIIMGFWIPDNLQSGIWVLERYFIFTTSYALDHMNFKHFLFLYSMKYWIKWFQYHRELSNFWTEYFRKHTKKSDKSRIIICQNPDHLFSEKLPLTKTKNCVFQCCFKALKGHEQIEHLYRNNKNFNFLYLYKPSWIVGN